VHKRATSRDVPLRRRGGMRKTLYNANIVDLDSAASSSNSKSLIESVDSFTSYSIPSSLDTLASSWQEVDAQDIKLSRLSIDTSSMANDSFEYANSEDRIRISEMSQKWSSGPHRNNNQSFGMYRKKTLDNSTDSLDDDDGSEMGWTFSVVDGKSDSTPSTVYDVPSCAKPLKTECSTRAEKFGEILSSLKKPGHHIGPAKNPDCGCKTCRCYFEEFRGRGRTRSVGELPAKNGKASGRGRLTSCDRDSHSSQYSYLKDMV